MDQFSLPMNLDVHLDKHLGSVQMADEQLLPACCRESSQWTPAAVFISAQDRGRQGHGGSGSVEGLSKCVDGYFSSAPLTLSSKTGSVAWWLSQ